LQVKSSSNPRTKSNPFDSIIFLFGPTGVGKTELLLDLDPARFSVINADSIQVYRYLDIGSAKADAQTKAAIAHYLIDIRDPWQQFSVAEFIEEADRAVHQIVQGGRIPVIAGGTAFYFKHFLYGLSDAPPSDAAVRTSLMRRVDELGREWAVEYLRRVDPVAAKRIHPSDLYRITRALEVWEGSGRPLSSFDLPTEPRMGMEPLIIALQRPTDELHNRIALRIEAMFAQGLEDEIRALLAMGAQSSWPGMQGIGYKEFFQAMESGESPRSAIAEQIARNSRAYAKRQLTFFKSFSAATWIDADDRTSVLTAVERYLARADR
jgi:tRNA dimethylallyltransferase